MTELKITATGSLAPASSGRRFVRLRFSIALEVIVATGGIEVLNIEDLGRFWFDHNPGAAAVNWRLEKGPDGSSRKHDEEHAYNRPATLAEKL